MSADQAAPRGARKKILVSARVQQEPRNEPTEGAAPGAPTPLTAAKKKRVRRAVEVRTKECPACEERFVVVFVDDRELEVMPELQLIVRRRRHDPLCELGAPGDELPHYAWRCPRCEVALTWRHVTKADAEFLIAQEITLVPYCSEALLEALVELPRDRLDWRRVDAR